MAKDPELRKAKFLAKKKKMGKICIISKKMFEIIEDKMRARESE